MAAPSICRLLRPTIKGRHVPFQIKDFLSITLSQINHARAATTRINDFVPGSVARTLMEAPAVEIEELYLQMFLGLKEAIPVATFLSFGFTALPASVAHGFVSVSALVERDADITVPVGTAFTATDGRVYRSTQTATLAADADVVTIPVAYTVAGLAGNAGQGVITSSNLFRSGDYVVSNSAITSGRDAETDDERKARFADFIRSLSRGTVAACTYAAAQSRELDDAGAIYEYVTRVGMDEQPGHVRIFLYSSRGLPSDDLLADGQARIDGSRDAVTGVSTPGVRAAGVRVDVLRMTERAVPLAVQVGMLPGYTLSPQVEQQLGDIFAAQVRAVPAGGLLYLGTLIEAMLSATGVQEIVPGTSENIVCAVSEALTPGTLTVTAL